MIVTVDTVSPDTTFDPAFAIYALDTFPADASGLDPGTFQYITFGDDELACTFPPPEWQCPQTEVESDGSDLLVEVFAADNGQCASALAEYELTVSAGTATFMGNVLEQAE